MMNRVALAVLALSALTLNAAAPLSAHEAPAHAHAQLVPIPDYAPPEGGASGAAALVAAKAFLASFEGHETSEFMFDLDAQTRTMWSNLPAGIVSRAGVSVGDMSDHQRGLLFDFLAASLGAEGYQSVMEVMAAEAFLSTDARAERLQWAPENYWVSFYGIPDAQAPWGWQFGGHHIGLNLSIEGNRVETMSPSFIGTEPAIFSLNGVDYEAVIDMHLAGHAVYAALDARQKLAADAGSVPEDVLTGPGKDGVIPPVIGLSAAQMTGAQRALLLAAIREWVAVQPQENAGPRMAEIEAGLDQVHFAWTGNDTVNTPTYMRIQGPTLIVELLSTGGNVGASAAGQGHYHTMYRNPTTEYGQ
ncbi:DUF3500 domain-containing protein [Aliiroseovarius sp.]|uniref:DUF3500 domain-containing protein n=1 Tax=Aliiroseovarius sp. TaxID=1872442 RepID=UPI003BAA057B